MKHILSIFFVITVVFSLSSCFATHSGLTSNMNNNVTNVVLQTNNYKIIQKVQNQASGVSVLGFGGSFQALVANARYKMLQSSDLVGHARAVINETVEVNYKNFVWIVEIKTVTISAYVIEFTDGNYLPEQSIQPSIRLQNIQSEVEQPRQQTSANTLTRSQTQTQQSNQTQQGIQVSGWYYAIPPDGIPTRTTVRLTVQRRETGQGFPQYLILNIDGKNPNQSTVASYNNSTGSYVFDWGNYTVYFTMR